MNNKIILIQGSLSKESKTDTVITECAKKLRELKQEFDIIDLRTLDLEFCDGRRINEYNESMQKAYKQIEEANILVFGMPVYCYSISGVLKNFIDITSSAMEGKKAGIICNAGSPFAYLAAADLQKVLSFESHVINMQPVIKTSGADFTKDRKLTNEKVFAKIDELITNLLKTN